MRHAPHLTVAAFLAAATMMPAAAQQQFMDKEFNAQWGLAAIGAQYALAKGFTGKGVSVGVIDNLIQLSHPEFQIPTARTGPFEWIPEGGDPQDHGTHVAGIIGAGRNGFGMEGVAPDVRISTIQAFDEEGDPYNLENPFPGMAVAVNAARTAGLRILNNSWGLEIAVTDVSTANLAADIAAAHNLMYAGTATAADVTMLIDSLRAGAAVGTVTVFATGNDSNAQPDVMAGLPYHLPELQPTWIAVTSVTRDLKFDTDVNACGVAKMWCMAAPGVDIYSSIPTDDYDNESGTSMAAPHVTGAVAIARQMYPHATPAQLTSIVLRTATDIGTPGVDDIFGWGLLNIRNLVDTIDPANGALFANSAFSRFAAADTLVTTLWDRSSQRILHQGGAAQPTFATAMAPAPITSAMALGGPVRDDVDAVLVSTGRSHAVWAQGIGAHASISSSATSPKASANLGGAIGGYDLFDNGELSGGVAIAYTSTSLDTNGAGDDSSADGWHGFAYATWEKNDWFVDGIAGGNWFSNDYKRTNILGSAGTVLAGQGITGYSSNDTSGFASRLTGGHVYNFGPHVLAPYAYASWLYQRTGGGQEGGADIFSLNVSSTTFDQAEGGVGVMGSFGGMVHAGYTITPTLDLAYGRLGGDVAFPVGFELLGTTIAGGAADVGRDVLRVGAQLDVLRFDEMVGGFVSYDGRFQENAQNNSFSGGVLVRF